MFRVLPLNTYFINERPQISNDVIHRRDIKSRLIQSINLSNKLEHPSLPTSGMDMNTSAADSDSIKTICKIIFEKSNMVVEPSKVYKLLLVEGLNKNDYSLWSEKTWKSLIRKSILPRNYQTIHSRQKALELKILVGEFHLRSQIILADPMRNEKSTKGFYFLLQKDSLNFNWKKVEGNIYIRLSRFESKDEYVAKQKMILDVNDHEESARIHDGKIVSTTDILLEDKLILLLSLVNEKNGESVPFPKTFSISFSVYK
jgi:hypothetical protein